MSNGIESGALTRTHSKATPKESQAQAYYRSELIKCYVIERSKGKCDCSLSK